ncbi:MAG: histone deacetylase [Candidatus Methylopumilus sp.]|nr:histone deacetylase [Candidatus Methylopumilus sp.]
MKTIYKSFLFFIHLLYVTNIHAESEHKQPMVAILYSDEFLLHDTGPNHPENPDRLISVIQYLKEDLELKKHLSWPLFNRASDEILNLVHDKEYVNLVKNEISSLGNTTKYLSTGDTVISKKTFDVATLSVGAGIEGANQVMTKKSLSAFAFVRPPGHHATSNRGMGFCVFNNIAIVARYLQKQYGLKRILIVDYDVHHGNGTQDIFYDDDSVFYFSIHQHPFYPGTGRSSEKGANEGYGFNLNIDLPKGAGDKEFIKGLEENLIPAMQKFKPEFILVSSGFDAHENDPLGQLNYTNKGYQEATEILLGIAKKYASHRIMFMLEGGYNPKNITEASSVILKTMISSKMFTSR